MKKIAWLLICLCTPLAAGAQEVDDFDSFLKTQLNDFEQFMDKADKEFVDFMRNPWKEFKAEKPVEKRVEPEPVKPVIYDEKTAPKEQKPVCLTIEEILDLSTSEGKQCPVTKVKDVDDITFDQPEVIVKKKKDPTVIIVEEKPVEKKPVVTEEKPVKKPVVVVEPMEPDEPKPADKPVIIDKPVTTDKPVTDKPVVNKPAPEKPATKPAAESKKPSTPLFDGGAGRSKFTYAGGTYYFSNTLNRKCRLSGLKENAIADAYEALYKTDYKPLVEDLSYLKNKGLMNDWMLFMLVKQVATSYCSTADEAVVMRQFLLNELGYKARMARKANENKLVLYAAPNCEIYGRPYLTQGGTRFYDLDSTQPYAFYMCQMDSPKAKNRMSMYVNSSLATDGAGTARSTHQAKGSSARVTVDVPKALMEVYKSYPQCDYKVYATAKVHSGVEKELLSSLAPLVQGKSEKEAADILLNFVQTGFEYQTDDEQFGYEKPFFVEELFYYPYCDCEDRSILYAYLVRNLLGLDVVYLDYPDHIATAVRFSEEAKGDYLMVNGQKYTVCDPTYIGASIGMTMPQYKSVAAKVLKY